MTDKLVLRLQKGSAQPLRVVSEVTKLVGFVFTAGTDAGVFWFPWVQGPRQGNCFKVAEGSAGVVAGDPWRSMLCVGAQESETVSGPA